jgi:hypothetical protein
VEDDPEYWEVPTAPQFGSVDGDYVDISDIEYDVDDEAEPRMSLEELDAQWFPTDDFFLPDQTDTSNAERVGAPSQPQSVFTLAWDIAALVVDYRSTESDQPVVDISRVIHWVGQFGESEQLQFRILSELLHVLRRTYFSSARIDAFLHRAVRDEELLAGQDPEVFWRQVCLIDPGYRPARLRAEPPKAQGQSRVVSAQRFCRVLSKEFNIEPEADPERARAYLYVDDLICSGGQAIDEIGGWVEDHCSAAAGRGAKDILVIANAVHTGGAYRVQRHVLGLEGVSALRPHVEINLESRCIQRAQADVYWPSQPIGDPALEQRVASTFPDVAWRDEPSRGRKQIYSSPEARNELELALLTAGMELYRPFQSGGTQRPLGAGRVGLGLGTPIVTSGNCPNNAPLAFWTETEDWQPLFPRRGRQLVEEAIASG